MAPQPAFAPGPITMPLYCTFMVHSASNAGLWELLEFQRFKARVARLCHRTMQAGLKGDTNQYEYSRLKVFCQYYFVLWQNISAAGVPNGRVKRVMNVVEARVVADTSFNQVIAPCMEYIHTSHRQNTRNAT